MVHGGKRFYGLLRWDPSRRPRKGCAEVLGVKPIDGEGPGLSTAVPPKLPFGSFLFLRYCTVSIKLDLREATLWMN